MRRGTRSSLRLWACPALAFTALVVCLAAAPATQKSAPAKPSAGDKATIDKAVADLKREYTAHAKSPSNNPLRDKSDYFKSNPAEVSVESILAALDRQMGGDARQGAYVKWQLMSALPEKVETQHAARLAGVYERAPAPALRYGASPQDQKKLDTALAGARHQDDVELTAKLQEAVDKGYELDKPVLAFRDELYDRLPASREKFVAALRDANARLNVAAPKDKLAEKLGPDLQTWAISGDSKPKHLQELAEMLGKLRFVESPNYYASAGVRRNKLTWVEKNDSLLTPKKFADLHKALLDAAGMASTDANDKASKKTNGTKETKKAGNSS